MNNGKDMALWAMILGIAGVVLYIVPVINIVAPVVALILGIIALKRINKNKKAENKGFAITGIVLGSLVILSWIFIAVAGLLMVGAFSMALI